MDYIAEADRALVKASECQTRSGRTGARELADTLAQIAIAEELRAIRKLMESVIGTTYNNLPAVQVQDVQG